MDCAGLDTDYYVSIVIKSQKPQQFGKLFKNAILRKNCWLEQVKS